MSRSSRFGSTTVTERPPAVLPRTTEGTNRRTANFEDQIRGYRTNQRRLYNLQRRLSANNRRYRRTIETQLNPEEQLQLSRSRRTELVPAEILYSTGMNPTQHRVYQHYSEEDILCVGDQQVDLPLVSEQSHHCLLQEGYSHIHIGLVMIRVYAQHRRDAGVNSLVTLRDTRWGGDRQIIATMEVDLTTGTQMAYVVPDIMMTINDFANWVEISVQTHGYDDWRGGESNLLISRMVIGRLTNTSNTNFEYNVQNVADYLASNGVLALPGTKYSTEELQGR
nr:movement protein [Jujube mosaic-associated virus]UNA88852.1 movement protein [Jujube mosaic-associated virus]